MARWNTREAAAALGISPSAVRSLSMRARAAGRNLCVPREEWPNGRTPLYDSEAVRAYVESRPGRGPHGRSAGNG